MSMTETPAATPAAPKKRKYAPRRKRVARATLKPDEFAGLTRTNCCDACAPARCVVSGADYCAHPLKGALQSREMMDHATVARLNRARDYVAKISK